jgi:UDP-N-acetylmuramoyl-L-alanyl-D-glutamate--2,6-diaminopimelate ligase
MTEGHEILKAIEILDVLPGNSRAITGLAYHSGRVAAGDLFVCIRGYKTDGHLFLQEAESKGASAAIVEEFVDNAGITQYRVSDSRLALAALAAAYYDHPSTAFKLVGVTATNGKTTTTYMINSIFEEHGLNTGMIGTVIVKIGDRVIPAELTTPESLDLQRYLREMADRRVTHAVMEVSSSGLELKRVGFTDFNTVVVNNISREHIDLHGSFENYFRAKASLALNAGDNNWAVFNLDCPYTASLVPDTKAKILTYGFKNRDAHCLVSDLDLSTGRAQFTVELSGKGPGELFTNQPALFQVELSVLGLHSVYNAMAATLVGLIYGIPANTITSALKKFRGVERRFELIFEDSYKVIDDHFANSGNIDVTLNTLQLMDYKQAHLVYAIRGSRGATVNRENAEAIARWASLIGLQKVIATKSISHVGEKDVVTAAEEQVYREVMSEAGITTELYDELPEAIARGLEEVKPGDVLLLAGCQGMDYGASVCLEQISALHPGLPRNKVFSVLKNRVAGV